jgi:ATP-dependent Clp protease adaptor protein ClpS
VGPFRIEDQYSLVTRWTVPQTAEAVDTSRDTDISFALSSAWTTTVWNDPVNLMSYVAWVFRSYFGFDREEAQLRMLQVHNDGRAIVALGTREEMERHVEAMHDFGLWATLEREDR